MRFLFRLMAWVLLFGLAFRMLRALSAPRSKPEKVASPPPRRAVRTDQIEDASFTEIPKK